MAAERVLITGGAGFIGCHTALALLERGHQVRALDALLPPVHEPGRPPPWLPDGVELVVGDVRDKEAVSGALQGVDRVLHLAAHQDYLPDFSTFFAVNTVGTAMLYEAIVERSLPVRKVVVASSQAAYGEGPYGCPEHGRVLPGARPDERLRRADFEVRCPACGGPVTRQDATEEVPLNPQNQYGVSKQTQEMVALSLGRRYGIPTTCMRYSITQGPWQSPRNAYSGICRVFTMQALAGRPAIVFEDGLQLRDYVHVGDVARANLLALEDPRTDFLALNVGRGETLTVLDYARRVASVLGVSGEPAEPRRPGYYRYGDTRHMVSDVSLLRSLGWAPRLGVAGIVAEYAAWIEVAGFRGWTADASIARMLELGTLRRTMV